MNHDQRQEAGQPIVLQNPDGSLLSGIPVREYRTFTEPANAAPVNRTDSPHNLLFPSAEARAYLIESDVTTVYMRNRTFFLVILFLGFTTNAGFVIYWAVDYKDAINSIEENADKFSKEVTTRIFWSGISSYSVLYILMGYCGYYGITRRQIGLLAKFFWLSVIALVILAGVTYLSRLSLLLFFMRLTEMIYAQYLKRMLSDLRYYV